MTSIPSLYQHQQQISYIHEYAGKSSKSDKGNKYGRGRDQHGARFRHSNVVNLVAGLVGTAAVVSIGNALCQSQEEKKTVLPDDTKPESRGKDVVATELTQEHEDASKEHKLRGSNDEQSNSPTSDKGRTDRESRIEAAVKQSRKLLRRRMTETGTPGLTVAVSVNGETLWEDGMF